MEIKGILVENKRTEAKKTIETNEVKNEAIDNDPCHKAR